jgi:hypothetical protein
MAPRGAVIDPDVPDMGYVYNDKYLVWSDNVSALYEEACGRQWSATRDIPWDELKPLPDDLERAQCQISTFLSEVEMIASDFPAKWLWQMNQHFHEVKMFLSRRRWTRRGTWSVPQARAGQRRRPDAARPARRCS